MTADARRDVARPTQPEEVREALARWFAWAYGGEEYADQTGSNEHWRTVADEFLAEPFMARLEQRWRADEREKARAPFLALAEEWDQHPYLDRHLWQKAADRIRRVAGPAPQTGEEASQPECTCHSPFRCGIHEGMWP